MAESSHSPNKNTTVQVSVTQQQYVVIEKLRAEGHFGQTDGQILRRIFQEFVRQEGS